MSTLERTQAHSPVDDGLALHAATICEAFQGTARAHADAPALRQPGDDAAMTWREYAERVERIAGALAALGVRRGETVAMLLTNRPETHLIDLACVHLGAIPFNLYTTSTPEQLEYLVGHAGARVAFAEAPLARALAPALDRLAGFEQVVVLDAGAAG